MTPLIFRTLLIASLFAVVCEAFIDSMHTAIPESVRVAAEEQVIPHRILGVIESAVVVLVGFVAYVGLFFLWFPARWFFLVALFFEIVSLPIIQPWAAYSGWELLVIHLDLCLQGVILTVAFSPLFPRRTP